jgi:UDP-3-O-[3-hydroxymyristoyl] glucosamine N-acyltransferase
MKMKLAEIARIIDGEVCGDDSIVITGISGIKEAKEGDVTFVANPRYSALMKTTQASAIITSYDVNNSPKPLIKTKDPSLAFARIVSHVGPHRMKHPKGVHPTAIVADGVHLGQDVAVGPYAIVEKGTQIGDRTIIYGGCYIGHDVKIGDDTIIYPLVSLRERVEIGDRVIVHSGTVIGSDGFGFATVQGVQEKIPQIGTVIIEDDVEIGANVTIDRARFDRTLISRGTKIDNLVQIAHNVTVGKHSIIVAQAGISGSTVVGDNVILAGQAGVVGHISIGNGAIVAAQAGVTKSIPDNTKVSGYPAKPHEQAKRVNACLQRLPLTYSKIKELEEEVVRLKRIVEQLQDKVI